MMIGKLWRSLSRSLSRPLALSAIAFLLVTALGGEGRADVRPFWRQQGEKPGPWMFNLKMGGAFSVLVGRDYGYYNYPAYFILEAEAGLAVDRNRAAYLILSPQFAVQPDISLVMLPFGFQYDIPMPLPGLYLTPRISAGFGGLLYHGYYAAGYGTSDFVGFVTPEFGAKYVLKGRLNFGAELFSLPIIFSGNGVMLQYRALIYGGINL